MIEKEEWTKDTVVKKEGCYLKKIHLLYHQQCLEEVWQAFGAEMITVKQCHLKTLSPI